MPSSSNPDNHPEPEIQALDELFELAGLKRTLRGKAAGVTLRRRIKPVDQQDLVPVAPVPCVAQNGVEWLAVPSWSKMKWLWHGFSTRRGGLSRAYCAGESP